MRVRRESEALWIPAKRIAELQLAQTTVTVAIALMGRQWREYNHFGLIDVNMIAE